ncbi:MAG: hypothetical protein IJM57_04735 [Lachnospiraceae bacterium]|nr:hypothetical protein [Lachnospiraceae bacterium]
MKRVVKILGLVLIAAAFMAMAVACGDKQKDYEELLKNPSKIEAAGKSAKLTTESNGLKLVETVAENGDVEIAMKNDKFDATIYKISGKTYLKASLTGEDGQKKEYALAIPESSSMSGASDNFDMNPQEFLSVIQGAENSELTNIKYVKTEKDLDIVTVDVKGGEGEAMPATLKFNKSSKKLAAFETKIDGQDMAIEYGDMKVSADVSSYQEGSESDIMAVFMAMMSVMAGGEE